MDKNPESLVEEVRHDRVVNTEVLIGTLALIIFGLVGVIGYMFFHKPGQPSPTGPTATSTEQASTGTPGSLSETGTYYEITVSYPVSTSLKDSAGASADAAAVQAMKQFEQDTIAQFKKDGNFANLTHDDVQMMRLDERKESLDIGYKAAAGAHSISYIFTVNEDTLGAHGNTTFRTFTFDSKTGAVQHLSDIFAPGTNYLATLSAKSRVLMPPIIAKNEGVAQKDVDAHMLADGTSAKAENFQDWYLDGTDLVILFAPYQVAPYAAGVQTLRIPIAQLSGAKANTRVNDFGTIY